MKPAQRSILTAGVVGCLSLAAGAAMVAGAFGLLWTRSGPPAPPAPPPEAPPEAEPTAGTLAVGGFVFGEGATAAAALDRTQPLPFRFALSGLTPGDDGHWWFLADIQVEAPPGVRVVEGKLVKERGTQAQPLLVAGKVDLASWGPPGTYTVTLKVEDLVSKSELEVEQSIEVR